MDRNEAQARWVLARGWLDERAVTWVLEQTRLQPGLSFCDVLARHRVLSAEGIAAIRRNSSGEFPAFQPPSTPLESLIGAPLGAPRSTSSSGLEAPAMVPKSAPKARPGELFGRYQVLEELGRGAMGVVLRGLDKESGREVAIKMLHKEQLQEEDVARFEREARTLLALRHPHILELIDCGAEEGQPYLVTEYIDGSDLQQIVAESLAESTAPPRWSEVLAFFEAIARALARCHENEVLHRDVKPQNIIIAAATRRAVLVDFGLMKNAGEGEASIEQLTQTGYMVGTPLYMSPEQFNPNGAFGPVTAASDVWGFGATLFYVLTGGPPYPHRNPVEIFQAIRSQKAPRLRAFDRDIPAWLDQLCAACLERVPAKRPAMSEVARRLRTREPRRPASSARPRILAGLAASLALIIALAAAAFWPKDPPETDRASRRPANESARLIKPRPASEPRAARRRRQRLEALAYPRAMREQIEALLCALSESEDERTKLLALCDDRLWRRASVKDQDAAIAIIGRRLSGPFRPGATRRFAAGEQRARIAAFVHATTGYELKLIPGSFQSFKSWEDPRAQERVQLLEALLDTGLESLMVFFAFWQYEPKLGLQAIARERLLPNSEAGRRLEQQIKTLESRRPADEQAEFQARSRIAQGLARYFSSPERWEELRRVLQSELDAARLAAGEQSHSANVPPFLLGSYEISVGDWLKLLPQPKLPANTTWEPPCGPETTAIGISEAATGDWLEAAGDGLRLPSRLEWTYAAAGGAKTRYFWGDDPRGAERRCWGYTAITWEGKRNRQTSDGKRVLLWPPARCDDVLQPNAFGLYSMVGNVEEWSRPIDERGAPQRGAGWAMGGHMRTPEAYLSGTYFSLSAVRLGGMRAARSLP